MAKKHHLSSDDEDSDFEKDPPKKKRCKGKCPSVGPMQDLKEGMAALISSNEEIKQNMLDVLVVSGSMKLPLSVIKLVADAFKCKICHTAPMVPPVVASKCCNTLLGCNGCINEWYKGAEGLDKTCPNCREQRGYANTMHFKGLDEFLIGMSQAMKQDDEE